MDVLYFRIAEEPDRAVFDPGWVGIPEGRFVLDRSVWRGEHVSRSPDACVVLRFDPEDRVWELKNRAEGRTVVLHDGRHRYDLVTGMSMSLVPGTWKGTLTEAFTFLMTSTRPHGPVRAPHDGPGGAAAGSPEGDTRQRGVVERARDYLDRHRTKRLALAHMWRQHLAHTTDLPEDLTSADVGRRFGVPAATVTGWREDLAYHVFLERGHQHVIRDFVVKHKLMDRTDVRDADAHAGEEKGTATPRPTVSS